jgi:hypothetical protein
MTKNFVSHPSQSCFGKNLGIAQDAPYQDRGIFTMTGRAFWLNLDWPGCQKTSQITDKNWRQKRVNLNRQPRTILICSPAGPNHSAYKVSTRLRSLNP